MPVNDVTINNTIDGQLPDNTARSITAFGMRGVLKALVDWVKGSMNDTQTLAEGLMTNYPNRFSSLTTTLYVNQSTGNDANAGTAGAPLKTLARAAAVVNNKFLGVHIHFQGNYNHWVDVDFSVENLFLYTTTNLVFQKKVIAHGEGNFFLRNNYGNIAIHGSGTVTIEAHAGPSAGFSLNTFEYCLEQGAIRCGIIPTNQNVSKLYVGTTNVVIGANAWCFGFYYGIVRTSEIQVDTSIVSSNVTALGNIGRYLDKLEFRKKILTTSGTWANIFGGRDLLISGTYAVSVLARTSGNGGSMQLMTFSGMFSWYQDETFDSGLGVEIPLHRAGQVASGHSLRLRTFSDFNQPLKLQIESNTLTSQAEFIFQFRKLL